VVPAPELDSAQETWHINVIAYKLPDQIKWVDNRKSGMLPGNMSRPHYHPNDRHFFVISGTWWVGTGPDFKPETTIPLPSGVSVTHFARGVHFDGAKTEQATILVWGEGPATTTPFAPSR